MGEKHPHLTLKEIIFDYDCAKKGRRILFSTRKQILSKLKTLNLVTPNPKVNKIHFSWRSIFRVNDKVYTLKNTFFGYKKGSNKLLAKKLIFQHTIKF